jgi:anthranilate phosphoribosyltransferase
VDIKEAIRKVTAGKGLTVDEASDAFLSIMGGDATPAQIAAVIVGLAMKGETVEEITGAAMAMREKATPVLPQSTEHLVDTCGTGGDGSRTFNISTASALVAAGAGARVAKHGNRSISSECGSADVLEALGVNISASPETMKKCLDEVGICFLFAPVLHSAMKHAMGPRREIGVRTVFNILGPLTNPSRADTQVLGVFSYDLTETMAAVLKNLGTRKAYVVHGMDPLDEVSLASDTRVTELADGAIKTYTVSPADFGLQSAPLSAVQGGSAEENAKVVGDVLDGTKGPARDIVVLNAAFALSAAGVAATPAEGMQLAATAIDSGAARGKLEHLVSASNA